MAIRFIPIFVGLEQRLDVADSYRGGAASTSPLYFLDQDVFNAMLCTQFADWQLLALRPRWSRFRRLPGYGRRRISPRVHTKTELFHLVFITSSGSRGSPR